MEITPIDFALLRKQERERILQEKQQTERLQRQREDQTTTTRFYQNSDSLSNPKVRNENKSNNNNKNKNNNNDNDNPSKKELPAWKVNHHPNDTIATQTRMRVLSSCFKLNVLTACSTLPEQIRYASNAINSEMAQSLMNWLHQISQGESGIQEWKTMKYGKRKVCLVDATTTTTTTTELSSLPQPLEQIAKDLVHRGIFTSEQPPNHVLLNWYDPATIGIMPHTDGPLYIPCTATLSLGICSVLLEFTKRPQPQDNEQSLSSASSPLQPIQVVLEPNSLIVFSDELYSDYCHGIADNVLQDVTTIHCLNAVPNQILPRIPQPNQKQQGSDKHDSILISGNFRFSLTFRHKKTMV